MNLSGRAVRAVAGLLQGAGRRTCWWCATTSTCRWASCGCGRRGAHGGQNGLRNIQEHLGTDGLLPAADRGRIAGRHGDAVDHVLGRFKPGERAAVEDAVARAAQAVLVWVRHGHRRLHEPVQRRAEAREAEEGEAGKGQSRKGRRRRGGKETITEPGRMSQHASEQSTSACSCSTPTKMAGRPGRRPDQLHAHLEKHGAEILASRPWDDRKLAYPIKGAEEGAVLPDLLQGRRARRSPSSSTTSG